MSTLEPPHTLPQQMKALRAHTRGGAEQLVYEDAPTPPAPSGTDVLVRVAATAVTFYELTWPETWESDGTDRTPIIPSHEFSGTIVATGPGVEGFSVGDQVFGLVPFHRDGAAAEYVLAPASGIALKPANVPPITAAAAVLPALTAMEALDEHLQLHARQRLLIRGGSGGVGAFLVQIAHQRGIDVTATVRGSGAVERLTRLGASTVLVGDQSEDIVSAEFDGAIDAAGAGTPAWLYGAVRSGGRVITLQEPPEVELAKRFDVDAQFFVVSARQSDLKRLGDMLSTGAIDVAVAGTFPLSDGRQAYLNKGHSNKPGKTVIDVGAI